MKKKLNKEEFEKLSKDLQAHYEVNSDGDYILQIEGEEDNGALKRAKDREVAKRKAAQTENDDLKEKLKAFEDKQAETAELDAKTKGDIDALDSSWQTKHEKVVNEKDARIAVLEGSLSNVLVDSVAQGIADDISIAPHLMVDHIKRRLSADLEGDSHSTRILDADGKPSALSLDELKEEFRTNDLYSSVMIANQASGGVKGSEKTSASTPGGEEKPEKPLSEMSNEELKARMGQKVQELNNESE